MDEIHSRSYLLVQQEIAKLQQDTTDVQLVNVELPVRVLCLFFPSSTDESWKDGKFYLNIHFPENFNHQPPSFKFLTIPFHPNVHPMTGECSLSRLINWNSQFRVVDVIKELQDLLPNPDITNKNRILNSEAVDLLTASPMMYNALAKQCSTNTQKLGDLMAAKGYNEKYDLRYQKDRVKAFRGTGDAILQSQTARSESNKEIVRQVAFEEYQKMWSQIGTTRSSGKQYDHAPPPQRIPPRANRLATSETLLRNVSTVETETSKVARTALKLKLDTIMTPEELPSEGLTALYAGRTPTSLNTLPVPSLTNNTPAREQSPVASKTVVHMSAIPDSAPHHQMHSPTIGVTMIAKVKENKDFAGQMPSLPASKEKKFRFRSDEPIFDGNQHPVNELEADSLIRWTRTLNHNPGF